MYPELTTNHCWLAVDIVPERLSLQQKARSQIKANELAKVVCYQLTTNLDTFSETPLFLLQRDVVCRGQWQ